jgi:F420-dependent methylenetetrahydromethanopterin dehydrogenase
MKTMIKNTIDMLREKVKENLTQIQNNQKEIRELLKQQASITRTEQLENKYAINKSLLAENNDFINVQLTLTNFLEKYEETIILGTSQGMIPSFKDVNECFELTVNGFLIYDSCHPYYSDDSFYTRLLNYYQQLENYEKCSELVNTKKQQ